MSLEKIFDQKIGIGRAQIIPLFFIGLIELNDGAQLVLSSFLNPIIKQEWSLDDSQVSLLASVFYLGVIAGSILTGKLSDLYGRKPTITIGSLLQILVSSFFFWVNNYQMMMVARTIYGFSYGFTVSVVTSMSAEIMPMKYRGKAIILTGFNGSIGKIYGVLLASIFLTSYTSGNWRAMMLLSCFPNVIVFIWCLTGLYESPRYLIAANRLEDAYTILNGMIHTNSTSCLSSSGPYTNYLTEEDKRAIQAYYDETFAHNPQKARISDLFSPIYLRITICLALAWIFLNSAYFGQLVILPFIFGKEDQSFSSYALTVAGQVPSLLVSMFLIDRSKFGRKNTLILFFLISSILLLAFGIHPIVIFSSLSRFSMKMSLLMVYTCSTEMFGTLVRSLGYGTTTAIGRLGSVAIPYLVIPLVGQGPLLISLIFATMTAMGAIVTFMLPYEPMEYALDEIKDVEAPQMLPEQQEYSQNHEGTIGKNQTMSFQKNKKQKIDQEQIK